jgi:Phosphotransferase enzyme family
VPEIDLVRFLLQRGVLDPADVVERGLRIVDRGRDRFVVRDVSVDGHTVAYVKQRAAPLAQPYLDAEIATLAYLSGEPRLARVGPRHLASDSALGIVAMTAVAGDSPVTPDDPSVVDALADLLATLHRETLTARARARLPVGRSPAPQIAGVLADPPTWQPPALPVVWPFVADPARLRRAAAAVSRVWTANALIHGDIKAEHCYVAWREDGSVDLRVIDWELSGIGDPAWDVACAVSEILVMTSAPAGRTRVKELPEGAAQFVRTYARGFGRSACTAAFLHRLTLYTALRFFQSSVERATVNPNDAAPIHVYLDWSEAILARPEAFTALLRTTLE